MLLLLLLLLQNVGVELPNEEDGRTVTLCITDRQTSITQLQLLRLKVNLGYIIVCSKA